MSAGPAEHMCVLCEENRSALVYRVGEGSQACRVIADLAAPRMAAAGVSSARVCVKCYDKHSGVDRARRCGCCMIHKGKNKLSPAPDWFVHFIPEAQRVSFESSALKRICLPCKRQAQKERDARHRHVMEVASKAKAIATNLLVVVPAAAFNASRPPCQHCGGSFVVQAFGDQTDPSLAHVCQSCGERHLFHPPTGVFTHQLVFGALYSGVSYEAAAKMLSSVQLKPPSRARFFQSQSSVIGPLLHERAERSMGDARVRFMRRAPGSRIAAFDGSWATRGYHSVYSFAYICDAVSGDVLLSDQMERINHTDGFSRAVLTTTAAGDLLDASARQAEPMMLHRLLLHADQLGLIMDVLVTDQDASSAKIIAAVKACEDYSPSLRNIEHAHDVSHKTKNIKKRLEKSLKTAVTSDPALKGVANQKLLAVRFVRHVARVSRDFLTKCDVPDPAGFDSTLRNCIEHYAGNHAGCKDPTHENAYNLSRTGLALAAIRGACDEIINARKTFQDGHRTQVNESLHQIRSALAPKHIHFSCSHSMRSDVAVLVRNDNMSADVIQGAMTTLYARAGHEVTADDLRVSLDAAASRARSRSAHILRKRTATERKRRYERREDQLKKSASVTMAARRAAPSNDRPSVTSREAAVTSRDVAGLVSATSYQRESVASRPARPARSRSRGVYSCSKCGLTDHTVRRCPGVQDVSASTPTDAPTPSSATAAPSAPTTAPTVSTRRCGLCRAPGHHRGHCPEAPTARDGNVAADAEPLMGGAALSFIRELGVWAQIAAAQEAAAAAEEAEEGEEEMEEEDDDEEEEVVPHNSPVPALYASVSLMNFDDKPNEV